MTWFYATPNDRCDVIGQTTDQHLVMIATGLIRGIREVVGLAVVPLPPSGAEKERMTAWGKRLEWDDESAPVTAVVMRNTAIRKALEYRRKKVEVPAALAASEAAAAEAVADRRAVELLDDAISYVEALKMGIPPAELIAERRGVTKRTAEGRIVMARREKLLSPAEGKRLGGWLTPKATKMMAERGIDA